MRRRIGKCLCDCSSDPPPSPLSTGTTTRKGKRKINLGKVPIFNAFGSNNRKRLYVKLPWKCHRKRLICDERKKKKIEFLLALYIYINIKIQNGLIYCNNSCEEEKRTRTGADLFVSRFFLLWKRKTSKVDIRNIGKSRGWLCSMLNTTAAMQKEAIQ